MPNRFEDDNLDGGYACEVEGDAIPVDFTSYDPISVICRVRVAKVVNGRVVDELVSGEVALYYPYDQVPALVERVLTQLRGEG